jgi:MFS family permease
VLTWSSLNLSQTILLSVVPGIAAVLCLALGVREGAGLAPEVAVRPDRSASHPIAPLSWAALGRPMQRYLLVLGMFTLARASETFIVLLGHQRGLKTQELLLLWAALNLSKALTSTHGGRLADRFGRAALILVSWGAFAGSFALFALVAGRAGLWSVTLLYGLFAGLGEGAERALISDFAIARERGTAFGWYNLVIGLAAVPAGLLFGGLWQLYGAPAAFVTAALLAGLACVMLRAWAWPAVLHSAAPGSHSPVE